MKLCVVLLFALLAIKIAKSEDVELVARAIFGIIEEAFMKKSERIEIISVGFGRQINMDVIDEVLRQQKETRFYPIETRHIDLTQTWDRKLKKSSIFLLESPEAFFVINSTMEPDNRFPRSFKILLYNEKLAEELIEKTKSKKLMVNHPFEKISFLRSLDGFVELNAITLFGPETCNVWSSVIINKFSKSMQMWETKEFFITAINQFYGCELKVCLGNSAKTFVRKFPNGTGYLTGPHHPILDGSSKQLNFTYSFTDSEKDCNIFYEPSSLKHIQKLTNNPEKIHITTSYKSFDYIVITTLGELYTPLEKLFFPFDKETWIVIGVMLAGALIVIFAAEHAPIQLRYFLFGRRVRAPALDLWIGIVGGANYIMPRRNWARILLAVYWLMYFVMQNAYQNKMFDLLVGNGRKPPPQSLEELITKDYTLFVMTGSEFIIYDLEPSQRPKMTIMYSIANALFEKPEDPSFKGALLCPSQMFSEYVDTIGDRPMWQRMESILTIHVGLVMNANDYFFDTIDQGIKKLLPTGIIDKGNFEREPTMAKKLKEEASEKVLGMKELTIAFKVLAIGLTISFAVFILEQVKFHLIDRNREKKKQKPKLKRQNAIRRKIKETVIVVDDETEKRNEISIAEEDSDDLDKLVEEIINANLARRNKRLK